MSPSVSKPLIGILVAALVIPAGTALAPTVASATPTPPQTAATGAAKGPGDQRPRATVGALITPDDLPAVYQASSTPVTVSGGRSDALEADICPTSPRGEARSPRAWAGTVIGAGRSGDSRGVSIKSVAWEFGSSVTRRQRMKMVRIAETCPSRLIREEGHTIRAKMRLRTGVDRADRFAMQQVDIRDSRGKPRNTHTTAAWRLHGGVLVEVAVVRTGSRTPERLLRRDAALATRLSEVSARRADDPSPTVSATSTTPDTSALAVPPVTPVQPSDPTAPYVVSVGDSYISGEGGAWTGNVTWSMFDDLVYRGMSPYYDSPGTTPGGTAEMIERCHRSDTAEVHIGVARSLNLACSGATAASNVLPDTGAWKPGVDFDSRDGGTRLGQARMLQDFAAANEVDMVVLSIGGNDFNFEGIVEGCVKKFLFSPQIWKSYCSEDGEITGLVSNERVKTRSALIRGAIDNIHTAMSTAGYVPADWKLVVQNYPSPLPRGNGFHPWQTLTRQSEYGCGLWNKDADWANDYVLPQVNRAVSQAVKDSGHSNILQLDLTRALVGKRLCENGVNDANLVGGRVDTPMADRFRNYEWVMQIRALSDYVGSAMKQESFHPNALGQLGIRNCLRQVYETQQGGSCERTGAEGLTSRGEPQMRLVTR